MILKTFQSASEFLKETQPTLDENEAANNLMYGLALRMQRQPERIQIPPYYAVVRRKRGLQAAALMTPPHNLVVLSTNNDYSIEAFDLVARSLRQQAWPVPGVLGARDAALAFARVWQQLSGQSYNRGMHERVYELRKVTPPPPTPGRMRAADFNDLEKLAAWFAEFWDEALPEEHFIFEDALEAARLKIADDDLFVWEDGQIVTMVGRARPTPNGICIGPVYTPKAFRRKGYASALTAAVSQMLLDEGKKFTALFTDLSNPVSNSIYMKIGYRPVCDFDQYWFEKPSA
jgi:uncharacterized protein